MKTLSSIFQRPPTRELEEVQKVNATEKAEQDVEEFYETESAGRVLEALGALIGEERPHALRFLYLHATFGSGKTHLLKLIGFATGEAGVPEHVATKLSDRSEGFYAFRQYIGRAEADAFIPVFLNLLNRDPAEEPPIPLLMFRALARTLGYPTDIKWLPEWALQFDAAHGLWPALRSGRARGQTFDEALADKGTFRAWLYEAVPTLAAQEGFSMDQEDVRESIEDAEAAVGEGIFQAKDLADRIRRAQRMLEERRGETVEFLFGLDEIALFVGDSQERYRELERTVERLAEGPNPVILGTGQWSLSAVHRDFYGEADPEAWYANEVKLESADTEIIVRKRWLLKSEEATPEIQALLGESDIGALDPASSLGQGGLDAVEAYPFRAADLRLLRQAMQGLLTGGQPAGREHIQGRALLVIVRALFARYGWGKKPLGALVSWDVLFDLLASETTYVPTWVQDLLDRLESTLGGDAPEASEVAKTIYLLNRAEDVPATAVNVAHLLTTSTGDDYERRLAAAEGALRALTDHKYAYAEERSGGRKSYQLLTEEEVSIAEKVEAQADRIPLSQLRARITNRMQEQESLLMSEGLRQEVDFEEEQDVPTQAFYSVLRDVPAPRAHPDVVAFRVVAGAEVEQAIRQWQEGNSKADHLEELLVAVQLPETFEARLRRVMATGRVLENETRRYPQLEVGRQEDERALWKDLREALQAASVYRPSGAPIGSFGTDFEAYVAGQIVPDKFPRRRTLKTPLQPLDDAPRLADFFQQAGAWPFSEQDAHTLGVDRLDRTAQGGWAEAFFEQYGRGQMVTGPQLLGDIGETGGAFLGTPREALAALLLVLGTARRIQLRTDGQLLLDPGEMGQAVRTRANMERLSVRLEAPVDRSELERLQKLHRALIGTAPASSDPEAIRGDLVAWAGDHYASVQQTRQRLARTFAGIDVEALASLLRRAARAEDVDTAALADPHVYRQAETFAEAKALFEGEHADVWEDFVAERERLQDAGLTRPSLEAVFEAQEVPSARKLRRLIREAKKYPQEMGENGKVQEQKEGDDTEETTVPGFEDLPLGGEGEVNQNAQAVMERLRDLPEGSIVLIDTK